jgi:heme-degrading monooxygenase HmoA
VEDAIVEFRKPQAFRQAKGFKGNYFLVDRHGGKLVAITLWDTQADVQASGLVANWARQQGAGAVHADQPPAVDVFEVVVQP